MMKNRPPLTSPDGSRNRNTPERCPRPLYSQNSTQEHPEIPQKYNAIPQEDQSQNLNIKVQVGEKAKEPSVRGDDPCKEEEIPPEISTDTRETQSDVKAEEEEDGHVKIKEEEDLMEISMGQTSNQNPPERCPRPLYSRDSTQEHHRIPQASPLYSRDSTQEHHRIPQDDQDESFVKVEVKEEEPSVKSNEPYKEVEIPPEIGRGRGDIGAMAEVDAGVFIKYVEECPLLYDPKHPNYKNNRQKMGKWREIAARLYPDFSGMNRVQKEKCVEEVKKRWRNFRDCYSKELRHRKHEGRSGSGSRRRQPYVYFQQLSFLRPVIELRRTQSNWDEEEGAGPWAGAATTSALAAAASAGARATSAEAAVASPGEVVASAGESGAVAEESCAAEEELQMEEDQQQNGQPDLVHWDTVTEMAMEENMAPAVRRLTRITARPQTARRRPTYRASRAGSSVEDLMEAVRFLMRQFEAANNKHRNVALAFVPFLQLIPDQDLCACVVDINRVIMGYQRQNPLVLSEREKPSAVPPSTVPPYAGAPPTHPPPATGAQPPRHHFTHPPLHPQPRGSFMGNVQDIHVNSMGGEHFSTVQRQSEPSWGRSDDSGPYYNL